MFCPNCGKELPDGSRFCAECGQFITESGTSTADPEAAIAASEPKTCKTIELGPDGKYRWVYEFNMFKNPIILFTVWQIMLFVVLLSLGLMVAIIFVATIDWEDLFYIDFKPNYLYWRNLWNDIKGLCIGIGGVGLGLTFILGTIGYILTAILMGGKEVMVYEMDEKGVNMMLQEKTYEKQKGLMWIAAFGFAGRGINPFMTEALLTKRSQYSEFPVTTSILKKKTWKTILIKQWFGFNMIHVDPEDYDFVWEYIVERVPGKCRINGKRKTKTKRS